MSNMACAVSHTPGSLADRACASALSSALPLKNQGKPLKSTQRKTASFVVGATNEAVIFQIDINAASVLSNHIYTNTNTNTFDMDTLNTLTLTLASSEPIAPASVLQVSISLHLWQRERESVVRYPAPSPALAGGRRWTPI
ncbi:hypothetical protein ACRYJU_04770 [Alloalcanivorax xenomutans]